jgi:parallel beta-helix repeat protein
MEIDGSSVRVQDSEFTLARQITDGNINQLGSGVFVRNGSNVDIRTSVIAMNGFMGVDFADATGIPASARGDGTSKAAPTLPSTGVIAMNGIIDNSGGGVRINGAASGQAAGAEAPLVQILSNDFANNAGLAVFASSSRVDVLANTMAGASNSHSGVRFDHTAGAISGNQISDFPKGGIALESCVGVGITGNTLVGNTEIGILAQNSDGISIASNRIEGTKMGTAGLAYASGHGIYVGADEQNSTGRYDINSNTVIDNAGVGVAVDSLNIGDTKRVMFSMLNNQIAGNGYAGITVQDTRDGEMFGNTLTDNVGFGVRCMDGPGQETRIFFDGNIVRGTTFAPTVNKNGHAVVMNDCHVSIDENQIENNAQYGILLDNGITGGCDDNKFLGQQADIVLQASPAMNPNGNVDVIDGAVANIVLPDEVLYDQDLVTPPMITPGM